MYDTTRQTIWGIPMEASYHKNISSFKEGTIESFTVHSPTKKRFYCIGLATTAFLLASIYPLLAQSTYRGCHDFHATIESIGSIIGLIAGISLIAHFYALGNRFHLFIGLAFFINGAEDFVHGFIDFASNLGWIGLPQSSLERFIPGTYVAGRLLMALVLILALFLPARMERIQNSKKETMWITLIIISISILVTALAFWVPLPQFIYPSHLISRPVDFISAVFFAVAGVFFLRKYLKGGNMLIWWITLSIDINIIGQLFMALSKEMYDPFFDIAHVYKVLGYAAPLIGFSLCQVAEIAERKKKDEALKRSEEKYQNLIQHANDTIISADSNGIIIDFNKKAEEMLGYARDEILGKPITLLSPERDRERERKALGKLKTAKKLGIIGKTLEGKGLRKDGQEIPVESSVFALDMQGEYILTSVIRDISERKKAEKGIRESRDFLESVIESSRDGIVITDENGYILSCNTAMERMSRFKKEELAGEHASIFIENKDERKKVLEKTAELFKKGYTFYETVHKNQDGTYTEVECNTSVIKDNQGNSIAGVAIVRDVSERKRFEEALKQSEEKYQNLIENANDAVISANREGIIVTLNKKAEEMYGYNREELLGKSVLLLVPPSQREKQKKAFEKLKTITNAAGFRRTMETIAFGKDGKEFPVEASMFGSEIRGEHILTSFVRDITERKEMEQKLLQSEKLKSLGELSGGVAHDFNNVLAAILGRVQLLKMHLNPPIGKEEKRKSVLELEKGLEIIEKASLDGAETVRRIQEFSRRRVDDKEFTQVDINELIDNSLEFTRVRWKNEAESKGIRIDIQKEFSPLAPVIGSPSELREVFTNLINNSIDAMPRGGQIKIKTFEKNSHISIRIEDTGDGISNEVKARIFDPFFTTKGPQSTGLGLSVSYGIINRHRGTIMLDSVEGEGTTFVIQFPLFEKEDWQKDKEEAVDRVRKQEKARILVVEDEEDVRQLLSDILTDGGHEVNTASNGSQGIRTFQEKNFDLVFTDLGMPGMSGWRVAEEVKKINKNTPVALITGWGVQLKESELEKSGADFIVHKPFRLEQILTLVRDGMELRKRRGK